MESLESSDARRWALIESLFARALDVAEEERSAFLDEACGHEPAIRADVDRLLAADAAAGGCLDAPADEVLAALVRRGVRAARPGGQDAPAKSAALSTGDHVGVYRVVEEIGRGGMGVVYLAERADGQFEQRVALKLLKRGMDSEDLLRRFLQERQILAWLRHPNIAALLDGGLTDDGAPYFVMELAQGRPITRHCIERTLGVNERLRLFVDVCRGVQHAHRSFIVHRDLKPSNIVVTEAGVKLLDFGVAKLIGESESAAVTRTGLGMLTPQYAAPEQFRGEAVTTATDVYALGMVLYELLTDRLPYRLDTTSWAASARLVLEAEPERPSRVVQEKRLARQLKGDLDNIALTALRKDSARRYPTVEAFADDVERHFARLPVRARPQSVAYRAGRFIRRHRVGVATAAMVSLSLVAIAAAALWQARVSAREARKTEAAKDFLASLLNLASPDVSKGETITTRQMLDRAAERIDEELGAQPEVQADILAVVGEMYLSLGAYDEAESLLVRAVALQREFDGPRGDDLMRTHGRLAAVYQSKGELDPAERTFREALAISRARAPHGDLEVAYRLNDLAALLRTKGAKGECKPLYMESIDLKRRILGPDHLDVATGMNNLAVLASESGDFEEAEALYRQVLQVRRRALGNENSAVANTINNLMILMRQKGDHEAAEPLAREALAIREKLLGRSHPNVAWSLYNLGAVLSAKGDPEAAVPLIREAIATLRRSLGDDNAEVAGMKNGLAAALRARGEHAEAESISRAALATMRQHLPARHAHVAFALLELGRNLTEQKRFRDAEPLLRESVAAHLEALGAESPLTLDSKVALGVCLARLNRRAEAQPLLADSHASLLATFGETHERTRRAAQALAEVAQATAASAPAR